MLRIRRLGRVRYRDALALQHALFREGGDDYLLLLEHPHTYTLGVRGDPRHVLVEVGSVGAELVKADRGGDVTYHGPGQLVGYPIVSVPMRSGAIPAHVEAVEDVVIGALARAGLTGAYKLPGYPGVWLGDGAETPRKICAVGVRVARGRSMHGFALNVDPDMSMFANIVPCGLPGMGVTSMAAEGVRSTVWEMAGLVEAEATARWGGGGTERQDACGPGDHVSPPAPLKRRTRGERRAARLGEAGVDLSRSPPLRARKPPWLRARAEMGPAYLRLRRTMRGLGLVTVCEEAGCPNIYECWGEGTATFMINGDRCTRACGFCLVDTRRPLAPDPGEPERVAEAVSRMGLAHAVVTAVARDDLGDGGAAAFAATVAAIRRRCPGTAVEVLVPDCKGDPGALRTIFDSRPDVFNHNLETVARLQRVVRPSASYARSLAVLGRARSAGLLTKSGLVLGMGEDEDEVVPAMADLRAVGVEILTLGQYLRPTADHLPVARWWSPGDFDRLKEKGEALGFSHVESSPLTRSSFHARGAAEAALAQPRRIPAS
jgi:lipoic acid synthetase